MTKKAQRSKRAADKVVNNILRKTWHSYSSEEKIRIVLAGPRAKKVSQFCAVARGSQRACFTVGRRNFLRQDQAAYVIPQTDSTGFASQAGLAGRLSFKGPAHARSAALDQISLLSCSGRQYFHIVRLSSQAPALDCALLF